MRFDSEIIYCRGSKFGSAFAVDRQRTDQSDRGTPCHLADSIVRREEMVLALHGLVRVLNR